MNKEFKNIRKAIAEENKGKYNSTINDIQEISTDCPNNLPGYLKFLVPTSSRKKVFESVDALKEYLKKRCEKHYQESLTSSLNYLGCIEKAETPEVIDISITIEWKKSQTWGANPTARLSGRGVTSCSSNSISGWGFDKASSAVAEVLNQSFWILKLLCQIKNKKDKLTVPNNEAIAYGAGYRIIPRFEGGVGIDCYRDILELVNLRLEKVASGKNFDAYKITKLK